ncbi:hypothetical protein [Yersinia canariae]|nr:hypothetical protein [Yersinia canariae]
MMSPGAMSRELMDSITEADVAAGIKLFYDEVLFCPTKQEL